MSALRTRAIPIADTRELRQAVLRPHQTLEQLASHEPPGASAVGVFDGEELVSVGFVASDGQPGSWRVRGMATAPHARGRGAGTLVLAALVAHARKHHATRVWANVRAPARSLYTRAGFIAISEQFELPEIGPHVVMELSVTRPDATPGRAPSRR